MPTELILAPEGSASHIAHLSLLEDAGCALPESWRPRPLIARVDERVWAAEPSSVRDRIGVSLRVVNSRRVPGARVVFVNQLGDHWFADRAPRVASLLRNAVASIGHVMRCSVRVFSADPMVRCAIAEALRADGFERARLSTFYTRTRKLDLNSGPEVLFEQLPASTRRAVRRPYNAGLMIGAHATREELDALLALYGNTFARRGVSAPISTARQDLEVAIAGTTHRKLVVLGAPECSGGRHIVSWALGVHHGDHATFLHGASEHNGEWSRLPLAYATIWELVLWAQASGASWFDLGGVPSHAEGTDSLAGISEFKRRFGGEEVEVAEEYELVRSRLGVALERLVERSLHF